MRLIETGNGIRTVASGLETAQLSQNEIPIIDFSPMFGGDLVSRQQVAAQVRAASTHLGFFYVQNHGVPESLINAMFGQMKQFFALPLDQKMAVHIARSSHHRGYVPLEEEILDIRSKPDLHEALDLSLDLPEDDPDVVAGKALYGSNPSLPQLPEFQSTVNQYYSQLHSLGKRLFEVMALILDLPENYFEAKVDKPIGQLRLLHTPPQFGEIDERQVGTGAHTDYECFTILAQEDVPGLQVLTPDGQWIAVDPIPDTFVVNIGDQMARWTNDWFVSTVHRGVNHSGRDRFSIPYFVAPNFDTLIEVFPSCISHENPLKYPPVIAGEYSLSRFDQTFAYRQAVPS